MKPIRIAIDGYNLAMAKGTGVATYGFALANAVKALGYEIEGVFGLRVSKARETRELMFFDEFARERKETRRQARNRMVREVAGSIIPRQAFEVPMTAAVEKQSYAHQLPVFDKVWSSTALFEIAHWHFRLFNRFLPLSVSHPPDIMHWTYPIPIRMKGARNIYTLHDLVPLRLPYTTLDSKKLYYKLIEQCVSSADHICTVSESSLQDIASRFPLPPEKITNTYQSVVMSQDAREDPAADARAIEGIFGLRHRGYFLYFGAVDPKKNLGRLIEAYLSTQSTTPLVIVGGRNWGTEQGLQGNGINLHGFTVNDRIMRLDYLPRPLLFQLVRGARAVIFPSLFEGFGLPVLEALSLGTPVITSDISSLPELVGDAGLLVDPYSVKSIAEAIIKLDAQPELCLDLANRGPTQAAKFSESNYHLRLSRMYESVLATGNH